jgi:hypothetical protein
MKNEINKKLANDVLEILSQLEKYGYKRIVKSQLVQELRQSCPALTTLDKKWRLSTVFINSEMFDILEKQGFTVEIEGCRQYLSIQ